MIRNDGGSSRYPTTGFRDRLKKPSGGGTTLNQIYSRSASSTGTGSAPSGESEFEVPERGPVPKFKTPEFDRERVGELTQKHASTGVRTLREGLSESTRRNYDNPNVEGMVTKQALRGYGAGLSEVMEGGS